MAKIFFFSNRSEEPKPRGREEVGFSCEPDDSLAGFDNTRMLKSVMILFRNQFIFLKAWFVDKTNSKQITFCTSINVD